MRNLIFLTLLFLANAGIAQTDAVVTDERSDSTVAVEGELEKLKNDAATFAIGKAESGQAYFQGILAGLVLADVDLRRFDVLDEENASVDAFMENGNKCLMHIASLRASLKFYELAKWPLRAEFHKLTIAWLDCVEGMVNDHYFKLAEAFSKADDDMTDAEWDLYDTYYEAMETYYSVDNEWVDFQYKFAAANGFEIGYLIDEDALVEPAPSE
ncbi:MAG: hypothetical protein GQ574_18795 [Crocinitomix sp.]|nr:hypothetical protein [Crocinitomix sp.]